MRLFCALLVLQILFASSSYSADSAEPKPKAQKRVNFKSAEDEDSGWDSRFQAISGRQDQETTAFAHQYIQSWTDSALPTVADNDYSPTFTLNASTKIDFSQNWPGSIPPRFPMTKDEILLYKRFFTAIMSAGEFTHFINYCLQSNLIDFNRPVVMTKCDEPPIFISIPEFYLSNQNYNLDMLKTLLTSLPFGMVNKAFKNGSTFLHRAIMFYGPKVVQVLLDFGADPNLFVRMESIHHVNAGMLAISLNKPEIVKVLAQTGFCDPNLKFEMLHTNITGFFIRYKMPEGVLFLAHWPRTTPERITNLLHVLESRSPKFAHKVLLQLLPFDKFAQVLEKRFLSYVMTGNLDSFEALIQYGHIPKEVYRLGSFDTTLFHRAIHHQAEHMIPTLIKIGLNAELAANEGAIPIIYAIRKNNPLAVQVLLAAASQETKIEALKSAVFLGRHDCAYIISKHFDNYDGILMREKGIIEYASMAHYPTTLWALLADGKVDPFTPDSNGFTLANGRALPCNQHIINYYLKMWQEKRTAMDEC